MGNTFGPIASSVKPAFHWDDSTLAHLGNLGPLSYLLALIPFAWVLDNRGLRTSTIVATTLVATGAATKCMWVTPGGFATSVIFIGQWLNALATPFAMSAGAVTSVHWFPPQERLLAIAIPTMATCYGEAAAFMLGPFFVPDTWSDSSHEVLSKLKVYTNWQVGLATFLLVVTVLSFPNAPSVPPSCCMGSQRIRDLSTGMSLIGSKLVYWFISLLFMYVYGFYGAWGSMLYPNLENMFSRSRAHIVVWYTTNDLAGWIAFCGAVVGGAMCLVVSIVADMLGSARKLSDESWSLNALTMAALAIGLVAFLPVGFIACVLPAPDNVLTPGTDMVLWASVCLSAA